MSERHADAANDVSPRSAIRLDAQVVAAFAGGEFKARSGTSKSEEVLLNGRFAGFFGAEKLLNGLSQRIGRESAFAAALLPQ